jgi:hypothetical protein
VESKKDGMPRLNASFTIWETSNIGEMTPKKKTSFSKPLRNKIVRQSNVLGDYKSLTLICGVIFFFCAALMYVVFQLFYNGNMK